MIDLEISTIGHGAIVMLTVHNGRYFAWDGLQDAITRDTSTAHAEIPKGDLTNEQKRQAARNTERIKQGLRE